MACNEIIEKIDSFLSGHSSLTEECHVVYLMVESRKILDHENNGRYPLLRFYCDWAVHTEKSRATHVIRKIMEDLYEDAKKILANPAMTRSGSPVMGFAYMENLKDEIKAFHEAHELPTDLRNENGWINFVSLLVKVLENQPIIRPTADIANFSFIPAAFRCVAGKIEFAQPVNGRYDFTFGNKY